MPLLRSAYPFSFVYLFEMFCVCVCVCVYAHALVHMHNSLSPDSYWTFLKFGFHVCIWTLKFVSMFLMHSD